MTRAPPLTGAYGFSRVEDGVVVGILLKVLLAVLLADFLSGLAHWLEDSYFRPTTPLLGPTISRNVLHHLDPTLFIGNPWYVTVRSSFVSAVVVATPLAAAGLLAWWGLLALSIAIFANQFHKWAHMPSSSRPGVVALLQRWHVLQSPAHHAAHHVDRKNRGYCVVTGMLNPVLDAVGLWRLLEAVVVLVTGATPRPDISQEPYRDAMSPPAGAWRHQ